MLISICCITYNHENYIQQALESFLMQKGSFEMEILINDDASRDRTPHIIRRYAKKYPERIKPLFHGENQYSKGITNPSGVFNFPRARGKYIALCEGDDYWLDPHKLQKQLVIMENNPKLSFCFHSARIKNMDSSFSPFLVRPYLKSGEISPDQVIDKKSGYPTASLFFPKAFVQELPNYYLECPIGDIPLQLLLAARGPAYYLDEALSVYRRGDPGSWSAGQRAGGFEKKQEAYFKAMVKTYRDFDRETDLIFHKSVVSALSRLRFGIYVNTRQFSRIFQKRFQRELRELGLFERGMLCLEYRYPEIYRRIRGIVTGK